MRGYTFGICSLGVESGWGSAGSLWLQAAQKAPAPVKEARVEVRLIALGDCR